MLTIRLTSDVFQLELTSHDPVGEMSTALLYRAYRSHGIDTACRSIVSIRALIPRCEPFLQLVLLDQLWDPPVGLVWDQGHVLETFATVYLALIVVVRVGLSV